MTAHAHAQAVKEVCAVWGVSLATISLSWTDINTALSALLIVSNIVFVWCKILSWWKGRKNQAGPGPIKGEIE